jgi:hypothetical protein
MSRRWTAKCWMGSASGYVDMEVSANTINGAKEQLQNIYGAQQIINLREVRSNSISNKSSDSSSGTMVLIGLLGAGALFLYFTPWVLMTLYGAGATWIAEKVTGQTMAEYGDSDDADTTESHHKKAMITFGAAILFGGIGFIHGTIWNKDLNNEYNLDGNQTKVEEVRPQTNAQ